MGSRTCSGAIAMVVAAGLLVVIPPAPLEAAADDLLADWQMNEGSNASTMVDGSGNGLHGAIGSAIETGYRAGGATGYHWSNTQPNQPPPKPERLVQVDDDRLNPGTDDYAITVRFRTTKTFGNIIQKGQAGAKGGYFKWQIPKGKLVCRFKGVDANGSVVSKAVNSGTTLLNDGEWHTVRCERAGDKVIMTIDGDKTRKGTGPTGRISNNVPLTIGGKVNCDQDKITCDYFVGEIDYVTIEVGDLGDPQDPPEGPPPGGAIFADDFSNGLGRWTKSNGLSKDGSRGQPAPSARGNPSNQKAYAYEKLGTTYTTLCMSMDVNVTDAGSNVLMRFKTAASGPIARLLIDAGGRLRVRSDVSGARSGPLGPIGSGWHNLELCGTIGSPSTWDVYRDGDRILDSWTANSGSTKIGRVYLGDTSAKTWTANFDNVVVDQQPG